MSRTTSFTVASSMRVAFAIFWSAERRPWPSASRTNGSAYRGMRLKVYPTAPLCPPAVSRKREEKEAKEGDYEFPMPKFDEKAFMRREVEAARMTFLAAGIGLGAGLLARLVDVVAPDWKFGWLPILAAVLALQPLFRRLGYSEENTKPRVMFGNWTLVFFTGLAVWVLLHNQPFDTLIG